MHPLHDRTFSLRLIGRAYLQETKIITVLGSIMIPLSVVKFKNLKLVKLRGTTIEREASESESRVIVMSTTIAKNKR